MLFERLFKRVLSRTVIVPGNHDRSTDNFAKHLGPRQWGVDMGLVKLICLDSTQAGNEFLPLAWGGLDELQLNYVKQTLAGLSPSTVPVVLMHHHVFPPTHTDGLLEALSDQRRLPFLRQADNGLQLLRLLPRRALVLHGHRHRAEVIERGGQAVVYNAGSTTELGTFRLFDLAAGRVATSSVIPFASQWTPEAEAARREAEAAEQ